MKGSPYAKYILRRYNELIKFSLIEYMMKIQLKLNK